MDVTEPFNSHLNGTVVAGLALDGRDDAPLALADLLANAFDAHLALVHAYPYESLGRATDDYEEFVREDVIGRLESAATACRQRTCPCTHTGASLRPVASTTRPKT
jgi:hypothetical protein